MNGRLEKELKIKQLLFLLVCIFGALVTGCSSSENAEDSIMEPSALQEKMESTELFKGYEIPDDLIERYFDRFEKYFSVEEYISLCNIASEISAVPEWALNKHLFTVHQNLATYNSNEDRFLLLDTSGNIVKDYGDNWAAIGRPGWVGDFSFIPNTNDIQGSDIFNSKGEYVGTFDNDGRIQEMFALGNDYYVFYVPGPGTYLMYTLHPNGEYYFVHVPRDLWPIAGNEIAVGVLSDGLFSIQYDLISETCGFYFDAYGERVIDLSFETTNFNVYELGDFKNGQAEIKFIGADEKNYTGIIDKTGNFINEPVAE